jgi:hypothetical protein
MHALKECFRLAAAAGLVILLGCGSGNSSTDGGNPPTFGISGAITDASGVAMSLTSAGLSWSTTTDANGNYAFGELPNGSYILTPYKFGYTFNPASIPVTVNGTDVTGQNFTVTLVTYSISGAVSGAIADGALITLSGAMNATTPTVGGGRYSFAGLSTGNYTVTPSKPGYAFNPPSIAVTVTGRNVTGQNFVSAAPSLSGVWGSGANDVWAVGSGGAILHWNETAWTTVSSSTGIDLYGIWGSGANDVWAVGGFSDEYGTATILHWNGSAWTTVSSGTTDILTGVWGSGASDVWAVGGYSDDCGSYGTILQWNGSAWATVSSGTTDILTGVWGSRANDVWAVGGGTIAHWDGTALWRLLSSGTTNGLSGVWGSGASDVWAVGGGGTILHWDGSAWTAVSSGTTNDLSRVWGSGPNDVWAVGTAGTVVHWNGGAWSSVSSGTTNNLSGVWGSGPGDAWAVGDVGTLVHWSGSAWASVSSGATD